MERKELFEFIDLKWWPKLFRSMTTDFLHSVIEKYQPYSPKVDLISKAILSTNSNTIMDMCSGSLGPWLHLKKQVEQKTDKCLDLILTDKYPNNTMLNKVKKLGFLTYYPHPVDTRDIPCSLKTTTRTIFNGFHHFSPYDAQKIISNSIKDKQPIIIFELLRRSWADVLIVTFFTPFFVWFFMLYLMKPTFTNIFFTYIIPIFPFVFTWDTIVSNLRSYTEKELKAMVKKVDTSHSYICHVGRYRYKRLPVLYLIAYPKKQL